MERSDFLKQKARNFQAFLKSLEPDEYIAGIMSNFSPENVEMLLPLAVMSLNIRGIDATVDEIMSHSKVQTDSAKDRLRRYLKMWIDLSQ
ncbi:MAG: hypothetical protein EBZ49_02995 [Proteobacteria bacterium]|nr:hypothetical protein [Pseudomonadota bacterium]